MDDSGRVVPLSRATVRELRAEATARGIAEAAALKRPELTAALKVLLLLSWNNACRGWGARGGWGGI